MKKFPALSFYWKGILFPLWGGTARQGFHRIHQYPSVPLIESSLSIQLSTFIVVYVSFVLRIITVEMPAFIIIRLHMEHGSTSP